MADADSSQTSAEWFVFDLVFSHDSLLLSTKPTRRRICGERGCAANCALSRVQ
jgi:hypothetical protein